MDIFKILILPIREHETFFRLFVSSLILLSSGLQFSLKRSITFLISCIPRYFILFAAIVNGSSFLIWLFFFLNFKLCLYLFEKINLFYFILGFGIHVQNMQDSCIGTHMAVCSAAFLSFTHIWHFSPCYYYPAPPTTVCRLFPPIDPRVQYSLPCVHVHSCFITCL